MSIRRYFNKMTLVWLLLSGIFFNLAFIGYELFWPFQTITVKNDVFTVLNSEPLTGGDILKYEVDYCRYTSAPAHVTRTLQGPATITLLHDMSNSDVGCRRAVVTNTTIPAATPPGEYYLKVTACYEVNPIRTICHNFRTERFKVR